MENKIEKHIGHESKVVQTNTQYYNFIISDVIMK